MVKSDLDVGKIGQLLLAGLIPAIIFGLVMGFSARFFWPIGFIGAFLMVTIVSDLMILWMKQQDQPRAWLKLFWPFSLISSLIGLMILLLMPFVVVTIQQDPETTLGMAIQVAYSFYKLVVGSPGSSMFTTIAGGLGFLGYIGRWRKIQML